MFAGNSSLTSIFASLEAFLTWTFSMSIKSSLSRPEWFACKLIWHKKKEKRKNFCFPLVFSQRFSINNLIHFTLEWLLQINLHKIRVWFELPWNRENMKQSNHRRSIDRFWSVVKVYREPITIFFGIVFTFKPDGPDVCIELFSGFPSVSSSNSESTVSFFKWKQFISRLKIWKPKMVY